MLVFERGELRGVFTLSCRIIIVALSYESIVSTACTGFSGAVI